MNDCLLVLLQCPSKGNLMSISDGNLHNLGCRKDACLPWSDTNEASAQNVKQFNSSSLLPTFVLLLYCNCRLSRGIFLYFSDIQIIFANESTRGFMPCFAPGVI